jgi:hypothetical protein
MQVGSRVKLVGQGPVTYTVIGIEHCDEEGFVFYRLDGLRGALFIASSLEEVSPNIRHHDPARHDL